MPERVFTNRVFLQKDLELNISLSHAIFSHHAKAGCSRNLLWRSVFTQ